MKKLFVLLYIFFEKKKVLLYALFFALIILFAFFASKLHLNNDLQSMLPSNTSKKDYTSILTNNKSLDKIIFSIGLKDSNLNDPDLLCAYATDFENELLKKDKQHLIGNVIGKQDENLFANTIEAVQNNLPFLLEEQDYTLLDRKLNKDSIQLTLQKNLEILASPSGLALKQFIQKDPLGITYLAFQKLNSLQQDENTQLYDGYLVTKDEKHLSFFVTTNYPSTDGKRNEALSKLLSSIKLTLANKEEYKAISCDYFGGQLVSAGNAKQMQQDTILTLTITIALLLLLFFTFFKSLFAPFQIMIPVLFGGLFSMACMYLIKGTVSAIALGASSVILGIAVNYSLHFLSHFRHSKSKAETIAELTEPMTIGGFTTIAAFLSLTLVHTPVLQQLGLFAAFSLIGSSLCTLIFLPHFISNHIPETKENWLDKLSLFQPNKNKWFIIGIIVITIVLSFFIKKVKFNEDLMTMNYMSVDLAASQKIINEQNTASLNTIFCVSEGKDLTEALHKNERIVSVLQNLKDQGFIKKFAAISQYILTPQQKEIKLLRWNNFWSETRKQNTLQTLHQQGDALGFSALSFKGINDILNNNYTQPDSQYDKLFQDFFKDLIIEKDGKTKLMSLIKTTQENRKAVYKAFENDQQNYITDRQLITSTFVSYIKDDFYKILFYSSFIVFFTILISYGRIEIALISFIPMMLTWICILGLMGLFGIQFNIINVIISTLIFGLGDDYSIFITDGLIDKYKYGHSKINTIKTSIYLSAITTIIGLGILLIAKHPALKSIAAVSVIGILSILIVSQTVQPLLFNFFIQNRTNKKQYPFTLWSFIKTIFAFCYYVIGCLLVTLIGFILIKGIPFARDKFKYIYHVVICKMMWSLLYIMGNVKKSFANKSDENFEKPCVIIANHSSFLDLLRIISLHPKILLMTNQWVWRSPVFGALVRLADYYPVEEGAAYSVDKLQYWVDRGYSIAVFPEGTRSYTDEIGRFKKGAFYLAQQLNLDILPVLFHGINHSMSKGDFLLKDGEINVKFLPRIKPDDKIYGETYSERAKHIGKYFRAEFEKYKAERETQKYFYEKLIHNYKYKSPTLEWYAKIKIKLENYYQPIESLVPKQGNILDIGCGYGFLSYLMSFTSSQRKITGIDYDEEKIELANHNFSKNEHINFIATDALAFTFTEKYNCIIILDVLHYLLPEGQEILLNRCLQALTEDGILIVRDGMADLKQKHKGTVLSELFSTKIFNFNKTQNELHFLSTEYFKSFANKNNLSYNNINQTKFTSNLIIIFRK